MDFEFLHSGRKLTPKKIKEFEARHGIQLPDDYKEFLLQQNGGVLAEDVKFSFKENSRKSGTVLKQLYPLEPNASTLSNLDARHRMYVSERRMPSNLLPIGADAFGNQICLSVLGDDVGSVYFWNHEKEAPPSRGKASSRNLSFVAESFSAFLDLLELMDDED